jgi:hypothetical protein
MFEIDAFSLALRGNNKGLSNDTLNDRLTFPQNTEVTNGRLSQWLQHWRAFAAVIWCGSWAIYPDVHDSVAIGGGADSKRRRRNTCTDVCVRGPPLAKQYGSERTCGPIANDPTRHHAHRLCVINLKA